MDRPCITYALLADRAYRKRWNDEPHPTEMGFFAVAGRFDAVIRSLTRATARRGDEP